MSEIIKVGDKRDVIKPFRVLNTEIGIGVTLKVISVSAKQNEEGWVLFMSYGGSGFDVDYDLIASHTKASSQPLSELEQYKKGLRELLRVEENVDLLYRVQDLMNTLDAAKKLLDKVYGVS